ncbi:MAG: MATE family efflux transporter [Thermoanaerobaculia bacterium]
MRARSPLHREASILLRLAGPLILGQLTGVLMTFVDTVMSGRLSAEALASVATGAAVWHTVYLFGLGVLLAVSPSVAHLDGAGDHREIPTVVRQAGWIALALAVLSILVYRSAGGLLAAMGIAPELHATILGYLAALAWGAPAMYLFLVLRFLCEGMGISRPIMYFGLVGLAFNVVLNYGLIYGRWGLPALGAVGCGHATSAVWWIELVGLGLYVRHESRLRRLEIFRRIEAPHLPSILGLLRLGLPIGWSFFVEVSMFATVALLMGSIGAVPVAAHQVAINVASITFMVPLGLSLATTVRVGHAAGRGDREGVARAGWLGIGLSVAAQVLAAALLFAFPRAIASIYSGDAAVLSLAAQLLLLAAVFQLPDGLQVSASGALRGLKDTTGPMLVTVVSYWLVGLPLGHTLAFHAGLGPPGLWIGITAGLSLAASWLTVRFRRRTAAA